MAVHSRSVVRVLWGRGIVLANLSGIAARCSRDIVVRSKIDAMLQIRREIAASALAKADEWNEPPLDQQQD